MRIEHAEIWNPTTQTFTLDASSAVPRTYHSSAVLVPDGRVFVEGGGLCGGCSVNHLDAEIYSPAYLFNEDGSTADRPTVSLGVNSAGVCACYLAILVFLKEYCAGRLKQQTV